MKNTASHPVVAITGGAQGIGRAIAERLAADGMHVAIGDIDDVTASLTAREISGTSGSQTIATHLDVTDAASFATFLEVCEASLGPVDILVNNAGIMPVGPFLSQDRALDRRMVDINVHGPLLGMRAVLPGMVERGSGHIVNIASTAGKVATPGSVVYSATKHAVVGMSDAVRQEFGSRGITVTTVLPSFTNTELIAGTSGVRGIRTNEPKDVAAAVARAIERKKSTVYVPGFLRGSILLHELMPARVNDAINRVLGADRVFLDVDEVQRTAYQSRIESPQR